MGGWRAWDLGMDPDPWTPQYELREVVRYVATTDIVVGKGPEPEGRRVLDARAVIANLAPTIVRPKP